MTVNQDNVLTIEELAAYLKISKSTLYKLAPEGRQALAVPARYHRPLDGGKHVRNQEEKRRMNLVEKIGSGLLRIRQMCEVYPCPPSGIEADADW